MTDSHTTPTSALPTLILFQVPFLSAFKIVELGLGRYEVGNVVILKWKTLEAAPEEEEKEHSFPNDTKQA